MSESLEKTLDKYRNGDYLSNDELKSLNEATDQMTNLA